MRTFKLMAFALIALLIINIFAPAVQAYDLEGGNSRSGKVVNVDEEVSILPGDGFNYTDLMNIANTSEEWKNNYNQTIKPFMDDNPDVSGIMVYPYYAPILLKSNFTNRDISVAEFIRLEPSTIIDGVSEFWVRLPVFNLTDDVAITLRIYRVLDPVNFNATMTGVGDTTFATDQLQAVYNYTYDKNADRTLTKNDPIPYGYEEMVIQHSVDYDFFNNQYWNSTWVKVMSALFPNENYYLQFDLVYPDGEKAGEIQLAVSQEDFCADDRYNAWLYVNGTNDFMQFDFDMSMIMVYGISNGITGLGVGTDDYDIAGPGTVYYNLNTSIPFRTEIDKTYFEMVIPILYDETLEAGDTNITFTISLYSSSDDSDLMDTITSYKVINSTYSFLIYDWNIASHDEEYLDHARINFRCPILYAQTFKLWAYQYSGENATSNPGFTDSYVSFVNGNDVAYYIYDRAYFIPYGYFGQSNTYWNATSFSLIVVPIETPSSPNEIAEAIHRYQAYIQDEDGNSEELTVQSIFELLAKALEFAVRKFIDAVITMYSFVISHVIDFIFGEGTSAWLWDTILAIGAWIWDIIQIAIDAFEWLAYWTVRTIYSLTIVIVYMINIFGVISINSALLAYTKTGHVRDFTKAFRSGWNLVWGIISLLISALIMAVSIIGAVVPF